MSRPIYKRVESVSPRQAPESTKKELVPCRIPKPVCRKTATEVNSETTLHAINAHLPCSTDKPMICFFYSMLLF